MKKNMGLLDRIVRFAIAATIAVLYFMGIVQGTLAYVLMALAVIFVLTSFVSFCPIYAFFGLKTCKTRY
nr:DUF2892 domain-containing protein [Allomuricauda sp.]